MKNYVRFNYLAITLTLVAGTACSESQNDPDRVALESLSGTYEDPTSYDVGGGAFGKRVFTFDDGEWTLRFTLALDSGMQTPVFEFRTFGDYEIEGPSPEVPGAYEALFREDAKFVTLRAFDPGLAQAFGLSECGLQPDIEKDVSVSGCAGWKPVAECNEDHDLLALTDEGGLRFGVRPPDNDMCTRDKRPRALTPAVVKR